MFANAFELDEIYDAPYMSYMSLFMHEGHLVNDLRC